ncbi:MAG: hypothetical protein GY756_24085 [bacterium]|nr:hypothetical protein [bacterium]
MNKLLVLIFILIGFVQIYAVNGDGTISEKGNKAKALVEKAIEYINEHSVEEINELINEKDPEFIDGEFYLFIQDFTGTTFAHGGNVKLVGRNVISLKDPDGVYFMQEFINTAKNDGEGWVEYKWANPVTNKIAEKNTYILRIGNTELLIGCGYYK